MTNPLSKYFREPGISVKLPSMGAFYRNGEVEFNEMREVATFPMTAADEIMLKNPDALQNGDAVASVLMSCCPAVKKPFDLVSTDVEALLLAIRSSTYGDEIEFDSKCPSCGHDNTFGLSIDYLLSTMNILEPQYPVFITDQLTVFVKPHSYRGSTLKAMAAFEQTKLVWQLQDEKLSEEEKKSIYEESFKSLVSKNYELLSDCIDYIAIPEGPVDNRDHIVEFVKNVDSKKASKISEMIDHVNEIGITKTHDIQCEKCEHQWKADLSYDPSHFFG